MSELDCIIRDRCVLGASPIWSDAAGKLLFVDVKNAAIRSYDPASGAETRIYTVMDVGSIALTDDPGVVLAALRTGFFKHPLEGVRLKDDDHVLIVDPVEDRKWRLGQGRADAAGRFWCGTVRDPKPRPDATLWRLDPDGSLHAMKQRMTHPTAICWSPDGGTMYYADAPTGRVVAAEFDAAEGAIANARDFAVFEPEQGTPDGATVDAEGGVWVALYDGGRVVRLDPDGKVERAIDLPVHQVAGCGFGGADYATLYVTTGSLRFAAEDFEREPLAGCVFAGDVGVKGLPEPKFGG